MWGRRGLWVAVLSALCLAGAQAIGFGGDAPLPAGVRAVWDVGKAHRETTATRDRISINGLWRWQPAESQRERVPADNWGYFKVPGCWPGVTDYMQKDTQTVYPHPSWKGERLGGLTAA